MSNVSLLASFVQEIILVFLSEFWNSASGNFVVIVMNVPVVKQMNIAMMWNRIDIGRKILFEQTDWNVSSLN